MKKIESVRVTRYKCPICGRSWEKKSHAVECAEHCKAKKICQHKSFWYSKGDDDWIITRTCEDCGFEEQGGGFKLSTQDIFKFLWYNFRKS